MKNSGKNSAQPSPRRPTGKNKDKQLERQLASARAKLSRIKQKNKEKRQAARRQRAAGDLISLAEELAGRVLNE